MYFYSFVNQFSFRSKTIKLDESDIVIKTSGILDSVEKIMMQFLGIKDSIKFSNFY